MQYSIGEFSKLTNLGIHTLRYYEQEHLITPARDANGRRRYTDRDIAWVEFIKRLKETGMPIREIQHYAKLQAEGDPSLPERMEMLTAHRKELKAQIEKLQEYLSKLDDKIELYRSMIEQLEKD